MLETDNSQPIRILGGGPAGSSAAIIARSRGAAVDLFEKSRTPRHKVCGEFLSPGILPLLDRLGIWTACREAGAVPVRRMRLCFRHVDKHAALPDTAYGLSRFALDTILLDRAQAAGARLLRHTGAVEGGCATVVIATGRQACTTPARRGSRLFGFKAHFDGPQDDAVELFFAPGLYVGINPVEASRTNVCGLALEDILARYGFDYDAVCSTVAALSRRLAPLNRTMEWLSVGPVSFRSPASTPAQPGIYPAGDAVSFVDPFTGTGITNAVYTGILAGHAAASGLRPEIYLKRCRDAIRKSYLVSSVARSVLHSGFAQPALALAPARLLFAWTRPNTFGSVP
jgi:flavin-dependent dehydrogenase